MPDKFYKGGEAGGIVELTLQDFIADNATTIATDPIWLASGDLVYGTGVNTSAVLPVGTTPDTHVLTLSGGLPTWQAPSLQDLSTYQLTSAKGQADGYASLDGSGLVPSSQLPSYVDDVLEYADQASFPGTGEGSKIYVAIDTGSIYRWTGSTYVEVSADAGAPVSSVNGEIGIVVLNPDHLDDAETAHKFVTATDVTNLGNLSGTNTGDQDLSTYQLKPSEGAFADGDKTKLDALVSNVTTNLAYTASPTDGTVTSSDGANATLTLADVTNAGLLSPTDFSKLANAPATEAGTLTTPNATPAVAASVTLVDNSTTFFRVDVAARSTTTADQSAIYKIEGGIDRQANAATTAFVGTVAKTVFGEDVAGWDATVVANTTTGALDVQVTGATDVKFTANISYTTVTNA